LIVGEPIPGECGSEGYDHAFLCNCCHSYLTLTLDSPNRPSLCYGL
jgi:hypothetical protein